MKKILIPVATVVILSGAAVLGIKNVHADNSQTYLPPMIQKLSERFGLNQSDVTQFMQEERQQARKDHKVNLENRLNLAVTDGKITKEQKTALMNKLDENWSAKLQEQKTNRDEMQKWMEDNGIDPSQLDLGFGRFKF